MGIASSVKAAVEQLTIFFKHFEACFVLFYDHLLMSPARADPSISTCNGF